MERKRFRAFDINKVFFIMTAVLIVFTASCLNDKGRIREVNKKTIRNLNDYEKAVARIKENEAIVFLMKRGDQSFYISLKVS